MTVPAGIPTIGFWTELTITIVPDLLFVALVVATWLHYGQQRRNLDKMREEIRNRPVNQACPHRRAFNGTCESCGARITSQGWVSAI